MPPWPTTKIEQATPTALGECKDSADFLLGSGKPVRGKHVGIEIAPKVFALEPLHRSEVYNACRMTGKLCATPRENQCAVSAASAASSATLLMAPSFPARRNSGNFQAQRAITSSVPTPPSKTAGTVPNHCAVNP